MRWGAYSKLPQFCSKRNFHNCPKYSDAMMSLRSINWAELFPTKGSVFIFAAYVTLFTNQGILVKWTQTVSSGYSYNTATVVLLTDFFKLIITTLLYCKDHSLKHLVLEVTHNFRVCILYLIPAFLYSLYNNLTFLSLSAFDPTTYYLLMELRVLLTGIIYQVIFGRKLSRQQWLSLLLLTVGCMIKEMDFSNVNGVLSELVAKRASFLLLLFQMMCSCIAGVYNEYLLKRESGKANIFVQNIYMYLNALLCNSVVLVGTGSFSSAFSAASLSFIFIPSVVILMLNNAAAGITTSFFLKILNSILKTFTGAIELTLSAVICYILFGIPITTNMVISIIVVSYATILYSLSPVQNINPKVAEYGSEPLIELEKGIKKLET